MESIIALIMIFGMPVFIVGISKYFKFRTARLELDKQALGNPADQEKIKLLQQDRKQLLERVENLETIVTSVDLELNARLNRLSAQQSILALPPGAGSSQAPDTERSETLRQAPRGEISAGEVLMGRFKVERELGHGGMGAVYLAMDQKVGEQVALKVIANHHADDPESNERFRREVSSARKITHSNVIRIHDLQEDNRLLFISMEYFPGITLAELLSRRGPLPLYEVRELLSQVCDALQAAHRAGVIHRDLKPGNVLVNETGEVRVIDFGLAKASYMMSMTATGLIMGTPEYMAPEQVRGKVTDRRTDIYALGVMTYHMLSGRPPFTGDSPIAIGFQQCSEPPTPPRQLNPDLPERVEAAVLRCLSKDPADRFDSVAEFKAEL